MLCIGLRRVMGPIIDETLRSRCIKRDNGDAGLGRQQRRTTEPPDSGPKSFQQRARRYRDDTTASEFQVLFTKKEPVKNHRLWKKGLWLLLLAAKERHTQEAQAQQR